MEDIVVIDEINEIIDEYNSLNNNNNKCARSQLRKRYFYIVHSVRRPKLRTCVAQ